MHSTLDQIEPNIECEIRIGKLTKSHFDTDVGKNTFLKILSGLEKYQGWEKIEKSKTIAYFKGDIRVIDNEDTNVTVCHKKTKIKKIDINLNSQPFDIRFSIASEIPCQKPKDAVYDDMRVRDRISFIRKNLSIDMTKVTGDPDDLDSEQAERYEIELEIIDPKIVTDKNILYNIVYKVIDILKLLSK